MLKKIEKISKKSFNNFTLSSVLSKINVFFGINGAGKTAISEYISEYIQDHGGRVMVFDSNFVQENILLENQEEIQGVALTTGKKEKEDKEKIRQITEQIDEKYKELHTKKIQNSSVSKQLYLALDTTLKKAKQQFKTNKIKQKPNAKEFPIQAYKLWQKDKLFDNSGQDISLNSYDAIQEKIENLQSKQREISKINFAFTKEDAQKLSYLLVNSVIRPEQYEDKDFFELLKWLEKGLAIHQLDESTNSTFKCLFCESTVSTEKVKKRINELAANNYSDFESSVNNIKKHISSDKEMVSDIPEYLIDTDIQSELIEANDDLKRVIDSKLESPNKEISTVKITNLNNLMATVTRLISEQRIRVKTDLDRYQTYRLRIEQFAKSWIGEQLEQDTSVKSYIEQIKSASIQIQTINATIRELTKQLKEIANQHSDLKPFQDICNQKFVTLGLNLKITINKGKNGYILSRRDSSALKVEDLSESERRLIGFLVFYFKIHLTKEELDPDIDCIVFDDPITSLDDQNKLDVIEMINDMINETKKKMLIKYLF